MSERPDAVDRLLDLAVVPGFTRLGYAVRRRSFAPLPDMAGRTVVITGATSGLGRETARILAGRNARVVMVARNPAKADAVAAEIEDATGNGDIGIEIADLSLMEEIRRLAGLLAADRIDVLVNNAGALFPERAETAEGIEMTLATNLLGHFLLTNLLIPGLVDSAPARIVNVSSGGMYTQRISISNLQATRGPYRGSVAYANTKRGQVILTEMWAERLAGCGVVVHAMHPGWADTPGVATSLPAFRRITGPLLRTPEQGADTIAWLAAAPEPAATTGRFWHDRKVRPAHRLGRTREDASRRERLWAELSRLAEWEDPGSFC